MELNVLLFTTDFYLLLFHNNLVKNSEILSYWKPAFNPPTLLILHDLKPFLQHKNENIHFFSKTK